MGVESVELLVLTVGDFVDSHVEWLRDRDAMHGSFVEVTTLGNPDVAAAMFLRMQRGLRQLIVVADDETARLNPRELHAETVGEFRFRG